MRLILLDRRYGNKKGKVPQTSAATPKKRADCSKTPPCTPPLPKLGIPDMRSHRHGMTGRWPMGDGNSPRIWRTPRTLTTPLSFSRLRDFRSAPLTPGSRHRATPGQGFHTIPKKTKRGSPSGSQKGIADRLKFIRRAKKCARATECPRGVMKQYVMSEILFCNVRVICKLF